jgi:hypothetical protein
MLSLSLAALSETKFASPGQLARSQPYEENPFVDGDSTQECYQWAADHECIKNPPHMLEQCKYSCWEWFEHRRQNYPDAKIDKKFHCHLWAKNGECHKNKVFMEGMCPESCEGRYDPPPEPPDPTLYKQKPKKKKGKKGKKGAADVRTGQPPKEPKTEL